MTCSGKQWRRINLSRKLSGLSHHNSGYGTTASKVFQPWCMYSYCCAHFGWKQQTQLGDISPSHCLGGSG